MKQRHNSSEPVQHETINLILTTVVEHCRLILVDKGGVDTDLHARKHTTAAGGGTLNDTFPSNF